MQKILIFVFLNFKIINSEISSAAFWYFSSGFGYFSNYHTVNSKNLSVMLVYDQNLTNMYFSTIAYNFTPSYTGACNSK